MVMMVVVVVITTTEMNDDDDMDDGGTVWRPYWQVQQAMDLLLFSTRKQIDQRTKNVDDIDDACMCDSIIRYEEAKKYRQSTTNQSRCGTYCTNKITNQNDYQQFN